MFSRPSRGAYRQRLAPSPFTTCHVTQDVGVVWAVILGQIDKQIGHPLSLLCIEAKRSRSPGRRDMHQHLLCCVVDRMTYDKGPPLRIAGTVPGVVINFSCSRIDHPAHQVNVGARMSELGQDELGRVFADAREDFLDKAAGAAVPAGGDSCRSEPEAGTIKIEVGRPDSATRRHGWPPEIEGLAQRIGHSDRGPRSNMHGRDVLGHPNIEQSVPIIGIGRHQSPVKVGTARAEGLFPRQAPSMRGEPGRRAACGLTGGPDPVSGTRIRLATRLFQDGQCVHMAFDQAGKRQISCRPAGERRETGGRATRARLREHGSAPGRDFPQLRQRPQLTSP